MYNNLSRFVVRKVIEGQTHIYISSIQIELGQFFQI